ncbi:MAG TPA: HIT family protein [Sphingomicrobium sp.]|nr:HIT family protein [Sphingomicrobium sp.]
MRGELPASKVCEDRQVLVFVPKDWNTPGELLVIPKRPVRNLLGLRPAELQRLMTAVQHAALAQQRALHSTGFQVIQNNGATSFQTVFHIHFHVTPSFGRQPSSSDFHADVSRGTQDAMAARLKAAWPTRNGC